QQHRDDEEIVPLGHRRPGSALEGIQADHYGYPCRGTYKDMLDHPVKGIVFDEHRVDAKGCQCAYPYSDFSGDSHLPSPPGTAGLDGEPGPGRPLGFLDRNIPMFPRTTKITMSMWAMDWASIPVVPMPFLSISCSYSAAALSPARMPLHCPDCT